MRTFHTAAVCCFFLSVISVSEAARNVGQDFYDRRISSGSNVKRGRDLTARWDDSHPCYLQSRSSSGDPIPQRCMPRQTNAALAQPVVATSTCGLFGHSTRICSKAGGCSVCDANHRERMHPAEYTVDEERRDQTCWISETFPRYSSQVNLTITLGKKYDGTGVSINFCNRIPDSFAIYKSSDYGDTWTPLEYYSSDCEGVYSMPANSIIRRSNEQLAICKPHDVMATFEQQGTGNLGTRFYFLQGRPSGRRVEKNDILRNWVAITHVRIVLDRLHSPVERLPTQSHNHFGISDVQVMGRCHCNGHASACIEDDNGQTVCDCKHNTEGRDCERCKAFHQDQPWQLATRSDPHQCVACNCNLHSSECRFSQSMYIKSGKTSGGVCMNCKHHTEGRHCDQCKSGYYRDMTKPITDRQACIACRCHPSGSVSRDTCLQSTGQCVCKDGVTGKRCDMCMEGYRPSKLAHIPCEIDRLGSRREAGQPLPRNISITEIITEPTSTTKRSGCGSCRKVNKDRQMRIQYYCNSTYVLKAKVIEKTSSPGGYKRFKINVYTLLKNVRKTASRVTRAGVQYMYVKSEDLACRCPKIRVGKVYLLMGTDTYEKTDGITLSRTATAKKFKRSLERKFQVYMTAQEQGVCESNFNYY